MLYVAERKAIRRRLRQIPGVHTIELNQMGYLMRQVEMCEAAADRRRLSLA